MRHGSLFSGIGGFDLAAQRCGWKNMFQVEIDSFCQRILTKNFPGVHKHGDIKTFDARPYRGTIDVLSGGFPCQPYSVAGKRLGNKDDRALWHEMLRIITEIRPHWIVAENVLGLIRMEIDNIISALESENYACETFIIPACAVNAPHRRDRVWIVAHSPCGNEFDGVNAIQNNGQIQESGNSACPNTATYPNLGPHGKQKTTQYGKIARDVGTADSVQFTTNYYSQRFKEQLFCQSDEPKYAGTQYLNTPPTNTNRYDLQHSVAATTKQRPEPAIPNWEIHWYEAATSLCRMDDGISTGVDRYRRKRLKALGNAIVWQIAYMFFSTIESIENDLSNARR